MSLRFAPILSPAWCMVHAVSWPWVSVFLRRRESFPPIPDGFLGVLNSRIFGCQTQVLYTEVFMQVVTNTTVAKTTIPQVDARRLKGGTLESPKATPKTDHDGHSSEFWFGLDPPNTEIQGDSGHFLPEPNLANFLDLFVLWGSGRFVFLLVLGRE